MSQGHQLLGQIAVELGVLRPEDLELALEIQSRLRAAGSSRSIGEILVEHGFLTKEELEKVRGLQRSQESTGSTDRLGVLIVVNGLATEDQVVECLRIQGELETAEKRKVPLASVLLRKGYIDQQGKNALLRLQERVERAVRGSGGKTDVDTRRIPWIDGVELHEDEKRCEDCGEIMLKTASRCGQCDAKYCFGCGIHLGHAIEDRCASCVERASA